MSEFSITVLNPKGYDNSQCFSDFAGEPGNAHPPISYHAYASCVAGNFEKDIKKAIQLGKPVLVIVRNKLNVPLSAVQQLKNAGIKVAVTIKETGIHQFVHQLQNSSKLKTFKEILNVADGVISPTEALLPIYKALRHDKNPDTVQFLPTPYPFDDPRWDFSIPLEQRQGILIGTRKLKFPSRNHLVSLILMKELSEKLNQKVSLINDSGSQAIRFLRELGLDCEMQKQMPYAEYLRFVARHRIIFQLDQSMSIGQVAGDAGLCRIISVGGRGTMDNILFRNFSGRTQNISDLLDKTEKLLIDDTYYQQALDESFMAHKKINFRNTAKDLESFFQKLSD